MYIDESYDVPGEKLIVVEYADLQTAWSGLELARLICAALDQELHLSLDMSKCHPIASRAIAACFEALLQIVPRSELEKRLWFYRPPDISGYLPNAQITRRKPQSIVLESACIRSVFPWNGL